MRASPKLISTVAVIAVVVVVVVAVLLAFFVIHAEGTGTRLLHLAFILFSVGAVMLIVGAVVGLSSLSRNGFGRRDPGSGSSRSDRD